MPLPDFLVIGAPRSGTTAMWATLSQHPGVFMPMKEPQFFSGAPGTAADRTRRPRSGGSGGSGRAGGFPRVSDPRAYRELFAPAAPGQVMGEASPSYLRSQAAAQWIRGEIPRVKLIVLLRHPVDRAYSSYWFYTGLGMERATSFERALAAEHEQTRRPPHLRHFALGLYHAQLATYFDLFPRDQIRVHLHEDWRSRPDQVLGDLFAFLGVDVGFRPEPREVAMSDAPRNRLAHRLAARATWLPGVVDLERRRNRMSPPPMEPPTRRRLQSAYREDIERVGALIERDLSPWLDPVSSVAAGR